ncbi:MAG: STAS domain-containing protein [Kiritimatiellae bacterium]|nr:STAS domain-containing protein [Kiritimatiellia bacterium]
MPHMLDVARETVEGVEVVNLSGALDTENMSALKSVMDPLCSPAGAKRILVDCSNLTYVNSACFGLFNKYHGQCKAAASTLGFCCVSKKILDIMKLLGLSYSLSIYTTRREALKALGGS